MASRTSQKNPSTSGGKISVVNLPTYWYVACTSRDLGGKPLARTILDQPLVLFRGADGRPGALLDQCPHRNVPLSKGKVQGDFLECSYHGWTFDTDGQCMRIPALCSEPRSQSRHATAFPVIEQDGFVWVYPSLESEPTHPPFAFPYMSDPRYSQVHTRLTVQATLHAAIENILDVPHTGFLHGGLFRNDAQKKNEITVEVTRDQDRVQAEYIGEPRPEGVVGKILAPRGGVVQHFDRFILPSVAQVEYKIGDESHLLITQTLTPESDFRTHIYAVVTYRLTVPSWLVTPLLKPLSTVILWQDASMLKLQSRNIQRFGGERYASTEVDVLGPHVLQLLKQAERGNKSKKAKPSVKRIRMEI